MKARPSKRLQGIMLCHVMSFHIPLTSFSYFRVHCFWNEHADEAMVQCCRMRQLRILRLTGVAATVIMIFGSETPMGPAASPIELRSAGAMPYPMDVVFVHGFLDMNSPPLALILWSFARPQWIFFWGVLWGPSVVYISLFLVHLVLTFGPFHRKMNRSPEKRTTPKHWRESFWGRIRDALTAFDKTLPRFWRPKRWREAFCAALAWGIGESWCQSSCTSHCRMRGLDFFKMAWESELNWRSDILYMKLM